MSTEKFIKRAIAIHGQIYDYSMVHYTNANTAVEIQCQDHGTFFQRPSLHINKKSICPSCAYIKRAKTRRRNNNWWQYGKSREFVNKLNLKSIKEWTTYCQSPEKPNRLPSNPKTTYRNEWEGWKLWIGYNGRTKNFLNFNDAKKIVRNFNLHSFEDWTLFSTMGHRPENIPFMPKQIYHQDWISWGDWLGYKSRANGNLCGVIYIIQYDNLPCNVYKIGRTYRFEKRVGEHIRMNKTKIKTIKTFNVDVMSISEKTAHKIAMSIGEKFKYRRSAELFVIDDIDLLINLLEIEFKN